MELSSDEIAAAGRKIYEGIREEMEAEHWGELVVIDVHSGDYEVGEFVSRRSELKLSKDYGSDNRSFHMVHFGRTWRAVLSETGAARSVSSDPRQQGEGRR